MTISVFLFQFAAPAAVLIYAIYRLRLAANGQKRDEMYVDSGDTPWRQRHWYSVFRMVPAKLPWAKDVADAEQRRVQLQAGWVVERYKRDNQDRLRR